jgi:DNA invertase Pin-like site-specific DNA recombinase
MARPRKRQLGDARIAIAYLRVSTPEQSLDQQQDAIERWATSQGIRVAAWCSDKGVSGAAALAERPAMLEALAALREHGAGLLVAAKRDRLARDVSLVAAVERLAADAGARVVTSDGLDASDSPEGQLVRAIIDAMAQYERHLISARTKVSAAARKKRGEVVGAVPLGFASHQGRVVAHPGEQRALARMTQLKAQGGTHKSIAATLTGEGYRARGERWHATTVGRMLSRVTSR